VVRWMAPFSSGGHAINQYEVLTYHKNVQLAVNVFHSTKLSERIAGLRNGVTYTFRVGARNQSGWSRLSLPSSGVIIGTPSPPPRPDVVGGKRQATVSWRPAAGNASRVDLYRVTSYLGSAAGAARLSSATRLVVTGLRGGGGYAFVIAAHNRYGWGPPSAKSSTVKINP